MTTPTSTKPADPLALLRTRRYVALLVLAAILGVPIAALAYFFLKLVDVIQNAVFTKLPSGLGFHGEPLWWPLLPLAVAWSWSGSPSATCRARAATRRLTGSGEDRPPSRQEPGREICVGPPGNRAWTRRGSAPGQQLTISGAVRMTGR